MDTASAPRYAAMGKTPVDRVATILRKIDSAGRSRERGFNPKKKTKDTSNKFIRRIERIFNNLPKPVEWQSFFKNDLPLLMDFCEPEIEPFQWNPESLQWPVKGKGEREFKVLALFVERSAPFSPR